MVSEAGAPISVWASLSDLLARMLRTIEGEIPGALMMAVTARDTEMTDGELEVLGATDADAMLAPAQVHRYRGPIVDAAATRDVVRSDALWTDPRWPQLTKEHLTEHAPLYQDTWDRLAGALSVPIEWPPDGVVVLSLVLDRAPDDHTLAVLRRHLPQVVAAIELARAAAGSRQGAEETMVTLRNRLLIEQAKGVVMAVRGCSAEESWATLRRASQEFQVKLRELAVALVEHVGGVPAEHPGMSGPLAPSRAARRAAALAWQALRGSDAPAAAKAESGADQPAAQVAPDLPLPHLGMLRIDPLPAGMGLRIAGEIDSSVHDRWESSLRWIAEQSRDVHLDLSELRFIDGRGAAILVDTAKKLPSGRWMVLHQPPDVLPQMLELLWPEASSTIAIKEGPVPT